jgi:flagellar motor switch protein FliG
MPEIDRDRPLSGLDRAAALLMVLGEREASQILKHMEPGEIHQLAQAMASLPTMSEVDMAEVVEAFIETARNQPLSGVNKDAADHIHKLLVLSVGQERAGDIVARIEHMDRHSRGMESLRRASTEEIAAMVEEEHPQVTAIILSYLEAAKAAEVLALLPEQGRHEVIMRVANLADLSVTAAEEINTLIESHFSEQGLGAGTLGPSGGPESAGEILNLLRGSDQDQILSRIRASDAGLAEILEGQMFTFDDVVRFDDRSIQLLLGEIPGQSLKLALKGADEEMRERFFANMSTRAADMLRDDLEVTGPLRLREVEGAQREIVAIARRLIEAGTIALAGGGDGEELVY